MFPFSTVSRLVCNCQKMERESHPHILTAGRNGWKSNQLGFRVLRRNRAPKSVLNEATVDVFFIGPLTDFRGFSSGTFDSTLSPEDVSSLNEFVSASMLDTDIAKYPHDFYHVSSEPFASID